LSNRTNNLLDRVSRNSLRLLTAALVLTAILDTLHHLYTSPSYAIGDWLINYSGGFVRRGLPGAFILPTSHLFHIPPAWMAAIVPVAIYVAFLSGVYRLAAPLRRDVLWYAMLFSPAALPFMILNPLNAVRKDVLVMAALTAVILLMLRGLSGATISLVIALFFAIMVLSHDALYCCFPYFFAAAALQRNSLKDAARVTAGPFALAAVLIDIATRYPGDDSVAIAVCNSVGGRWISIDDTNDLCSGAIKHLGWTFQKARQQELENLHYWPLYALLAVLSFAPFVAMLIVLWKRGGLRFQVKVIAWTAALSAVSSLPLFYLTTDWGRWIHMQVICLMLVILMAERLAPAPQPEIAGMTKSRTPRQPVLAFVAFVYCISWTLPVYAAFPVRWGYVDVARVLHHVIPFTHRVQAQHPIDRGW
jgi:hypothetical protein